MTQSSIKHHKTAPNKEQGDHSANDERLRRPGLERVSEIVCRRHHSQQPMGFKSSDS